MNMVKGTKMKRTWIMFYASSILWFSANAIAVDYDEVDKIIAETRASLLKAHPACAEIFKQEEVNPGDNDLQCANFEFEKADKELNITYKSVRTSLPDERKATLKREQIAWIKDKESFCEGAANRAMSMSPRFREAATNFCLAEVTQKRTEYLKHFN
jgi:uncharacterized protein YecT (DUF1311 family)